MKKFTRTQIEQAKAKVAQTNAHYDMQISPRIYVVFGTVNMIVTKCDGTKDGKQKWVRNWRIKTAAMINAELDEQPWL